MPKDTIIPVNFSEKDEMQGALEALKRNTDNIIELSHLVAKIRRQSYLAYIDQGFTESQALELCKNSTLEL